MTDQISAGERSLWRTDWRSDHAPSLWKSRALAALDALEAAEATIARVEALADEWHQHTDESRAVVPCLLCDRADDLRAALKGPSDD